MSSTSSALEDHDLLTYGQKDLSGSIRTLDGRELERVIQIIRNVSSILFSSPHVDH